MQFDYNFMLLAMIFMRMSGCILFNPILGRKNIPVILNIGLCLLLSFFVYPLVPQQELVLRSFFIFFITALRELLIGFVIGFIVNMFLAIFVVNGEIMDMQIGFAMSKVYDPQSNVSMPLSASLINAMFFLIFFAVNGHLTLIQIFTKLCTMLPYGTFSINTSALWELGSLFSLILVYAVKMSLPVLAAGIITEVGVGLIMKAVPQINVFVINIQLKLIMGLLVILLMVPTLANFLEKIILFMFDYISKIFGLLT